MDTQKKKSRGMLFIGVASIIWSISIAAFVLVSKMAAQNRIKLATNRRALRLQGLNQMIMSATLYELSANPARALPFNFGKGFFQIDELDITGESNGSFIAPETDVRVQLAQNAAPYRRVTIGYNICRMPVSGRERFDGGGIDAGMGQNWGVPCPPDQLREVIASVWVRP